MSRNIIDSFATKTTRNDRFAQMSRQEQIIEQKKREIQARLQQKEKDNSAKPSNKTSTEPKKNTKQNWKGSAGSKPNQNANNKSGSSVFNLFSNDGSFLDQFRQMKSYESKNSSYSSSKEKNRDRDDRNYSDERNNKPSRWSKPRNQSNYEENPHRKSRFSDRAPDPHIDPPTSVSYSQNFSPDIYPLQNPTYPIQTSIVSTITQQCPTITNFSPITTVAPLLIPPPISITVPPPQLNPQPLLAPPPSIVNQPNLTLNVPPPPVITVQNQISVPPPCIQTVELTSIPAPNPIPVHTIPQPEPINTLTIPPPAPLQLQNIPSPSPIRLNEIPNPKPIDLLNIPAPDEPKLNKSITDPDFIKNIPPPNKSVPPPNLGTVTVTELPNITIPPPATSLPPPIHITTNTQLLNIISTSTISNSNIPPLMAQPILPPNLTQVTVCQINVPPPVNAPPIPGPPPVLSQPPPLAQTNQIPPMNFPPPLQMTVTTPGNELNTESSADEAMVSLARMVAQCGPGIEDIVQQRSSQDPSLWFLFNKQSAAYQQYRQIVEQCRAEIAADKDEYHPEDIYEPENATDDESDQGKSLKSEETDHQYHPVQFTKESDSSDRKRKRKSRWGGKISDPSLLQPISSLPSLPTPTTPLATPSQPPLLSKVTRSDPGLLQYAVSTFGSANLSEEEWGKAEDHYKIHLLYQDMLRKREEVERLQRAGRNKYEYDSDEETDGGTWEHKLRMQEMEATQLWANELTRQAEGKHHIGDFLPPEELKKFMEKYSASKEGRTPNLSDYKDFKLKEDNIGFKMLQKLGWQEGQGLGTEGKGIVEPINKGSLRDQNQGLGLESQENFDNNDDEYAAYRKRMMLAYRFRPNPLNNPRRPYY